MLCGASPSGGSRGSWTWEGAYVSGWELSRIVGTEVVDGDGAVRESLLDEGSYLGPPPTREGAPKPRHVNARPVSLGYLGHLGETSFEGIIPKRNIFVLFVRRAVLIHVLRAIADLGDHVSHEDGAGVHFDELNLTKLERMMNPTVAVEGTSTEPGSVRSLGSRPTPRESENEASAPSAAVVTNVSDEGRPRSPGRRGISADVGDHPAHLHRPV